MVVEFYVYQLISLFIKNFFSSTVTPACPTVAGLACFAVSRFSADEEDGEAGGLGGERAGAV